VVWGRGLHSFRFQLNLSSSFHRFPKLSHESVLELLKLSVNVNECKPLVCGVRPCQLGGDGLHLLARELGALLRAGAYTRPLFSSTKPLSVG